MNRRHRVVSVLAGAFFLQAATLNRPAPGFSLKNSRHQQRKLSDFRGDVVLINFWASWCGPCQQELPELARLSAEFRSKHVKVLLLNVDSERASGQRLVSKLHLSDFPAEVLWDPQSKVAAAYDIPAMPSSFILDTHGSVRYIHSGFHAEDVSLWRQEINQLLKK